MIACRREEELKPETLAAQACECLEQQSKGTIDERLEPCFSKPINEKIDQIHKQYYTSEPLDRAIQNYMLDVTVMLIRNCDKFSSEMDLMYTNFYPEISPEEFQREMKVIKDSIDNNLITDSTEIKLIHKRITLNSRSRNFKDAIKEIEILENNFNLKSETHFARAYILRANGDYDGAISEIKKAMNLGENRDYAIFIELLEKKKAGNNT